MLYFAVFVLIISKVEGYCWEPKTSPFTGPPQVSRNGDEATIDWKVVFKDNPGCTEIDFLIMNHPRKQLSAYKLSDFTLKGERSATITIDGSLDFVFQVIAREDKGSLGIDYKYSPMITSYVNGQPPEDEEEEKPKKKSVFLDSNAWTPTTPGTTFTTISTTTTTLPRTYLQPETKALSLSPLHYETYDYDNAVSNSDSDYNPNPWYIYECVPFIKDLKGYDEVSGSENKLLENFIKQMNKKPLELVDEFLTQDKFSNQDQCGANKNSDTSKGYLTKCGDSGQEKCCPNPWQEKGCQSACFVNYSPCDGGRCIPESWIGDGWPDCIDGTDENQGNKQSLPEQLVCVQCAGVVLSAGFLCRESSLGLTNDCIEQVMGKNGACNSCVSYYLNLP